MKKVSLVLCVLLTLSMVLTGCKPAPDLKVFNSWVSINGFAPGMGQQTFLSFLSSFTYQGKQLEAEGSFYEIPGGSSFSVGTDFWGMNSDATISNNKNRTYNHFYILKNLDNLELPGGVRIGDSMDDCMEKLDLSGKKLNVKDIEIGNKTCEMDFTDSVLVYKESYDWYRDDGKISQVTRSVILKFVNDSLYEFSVSVSEEYPIS